MPADALGDKHIRTPAGIKTKKETSTATKSNRRVTPPAHHLYTLYNPPGSHSAASSGARRAGEEGRALEEGGGASWPARPSSARGARRAARRGAALEPTPKAGASHARGRGELGRLGDTQVVWAR